MSDCKLIENTWSFKPITFEESVIFMINIKIHLIWIATQCGFPGIFGSQLKEA